MWQGIRGKKRPAHSGFRWGGGVGFRVVQRGVGVPGGYIDWVKKTYGVKCRGQRLTYAKDRSPQEVGEKDLLLPHDKLKRKKGFERRGGGYPHTAKK